MVINHIIKKILRQNSLTLYEKRRLKTESSHV